MAETKSDTPLAGKTTVDHTPAAKIPAATEFSTSGAPRQVTDIPVDHPAVDNDPRAGTTERQNQIDMNDPTIEGHQAVEQSLKAQA